MELRKHWDPRVILLAVYVVALLVYMIIGLKPAGATEPIASKSLSIPSIGLKSDVVTLNLEDHRLKTPDTIVGSYSRSKNKTLLIGHSTTIFQELSDVKVGDVVIYNEKEYHISTTDVVEKTEIRMSRLLKSERKDTIVIMTCAGTLLEDGDATHRLIITAEA